MNNLCWIFFEINRRNHVFCAFKITKLYLFQINTYFAYDMMSVRLIALPEEGPRITGGRPRYQIGDMVRVNCTAGRSKPATHLNWFINGDPADVSLLRQQPPMATGLDGLETSTLGLEFRVKPKHFRRGDMKLKVYKCKMFMLFRSAYVNYIFDETSVWQQSPRFTGEATRKALRVTNRRRLRHLSPGKQSIRVALERTECKVTYNLLNIYICSHLHYRHPNPQIQRPTRRHTAQGITHTCWSPLWTPHVWPHSSRCGCTELSRGSN